jgi:phenylalanyl-tRNA synthetase beta chain
MKVSYNWLQDYFEDKLPAPEKLVEALTMHAFELESFEKIDDDFLLDIKILPERGHDCLSHLGIAKEISALINSKLKKISFPFDYKNSKEVAIEVSNQKLCPRFSALVIKNIKVKESPEWLKKRLEILGQKSINNIVDITNYVMFAIKAIHAYDADKLKKDETGKNIISVRELSEDSSFTALDNKEYKLEKGTLVNVDGVSGEILGLAGIKGGKKAEIDSNTKNIILESANFDPVLIRKTSKKLNLRTDASDRFEKGITSEQTLDSLSLAAKMILDIAGDKETEVEGYFDFYPEKESKISIEISVAEINKLLGSDIKNEDVRSILNRSGFEWKEQDGNFIMAIPPERLDLRIKQDMARQVGRIYGYYKIQPSPILKEGVQGINKRFYYSMKISDLLAKAGFSEVYTYSFTDKKNGKVEIENPLASDKGFLRISLVEGLSKSLELNLRNSPLLGTDEIKIFEIGKVFPEKGVEKTSLGIAYGSKNKKAKDIEKFLSDTKDLILKEVGISSVDSVISGNVLEIDFDNLLEELLEPKENIKLEHQIKSVKYKKISAYPFIARDIAVFVPQGVKENELAEIIKRETGELLVNLRLFDVFEKKFPDGTAKTSYAFRLVFQSMEKTLSDEEINKIMEKITSIFNEKPGWQVR